MLNEVATCRSKMDFLPRSKARHNVLQHQTLYDYLQSPVRIVSTYNYDSYGRDTHSPTTEGLPSLKINELEADDIDGHFPIRKARSLPPLGKISRREVSDVDVSKSSTCVHNLTVQHRKTANIKNSGAMRKRYLLWVPAKATGKQKTKPRSVPISSRLSSSRPSPHHHLHVALLPSANLGSNLLGYNEPVKANRLPKGKQSVRFRQTPKYFGRRSSNSCVDQMDHNHNHNSHDVEVSISGSSLTDVPKWISQTRDSLLETSIAEEGKSSAAKTADVPVSQLSKEPTTTIKLKRPGPILQPLAVKTLTCQAELPSVSQSKLSLSAELLSGSMAGLLRGRGLVSKDNSVNGQGETSSNTVTSLSQITLPQLPFESAPVSSQGLAVSGSNLLLHSVRNGLHNHRLSTHIERSCQPFVEGTQVVLQSTHQINVVIPSEVPEEDLSSDEPPCQSNIPILPSASDQGFEVSHPPVAPPPTASSQYTDITVDNIPVTPVPTPVSTGCYDNDVSNLGDNPDGHYHTTGLEVYALEEESDISTSIGDAELLQS